MSDLAPRVNIPGLLLKGVLSEIPVVGGILTEVLAETIPSYREQRLVRLFEDLGDRISALEDDVIRRRLQEPVFVDLLEDAIRSAARATSSDRLRYVAAVLTHGLTADKADAAAHKHLLQLMDELNDSELLLLALYAREGPDYDEFWRRNSTVFQLPAVIDPSGPAQDRSVVETSYLEHLKRLRLLDVDTTPAKGPADNLKRPRVTDLGRLLLRVAGDGSQVAGSGAASNAERYIEQARAEAGLFWMDVGRWIEQSVAIWRESHQSVNVVVGTKWRKSER
jgi:hypothetical protein